MILTNIDFLLIQEMINNTACRQCTLSHMYSVECYNILF